MFENLLESKMSRTWKQTDSMLARMICPCWVSSFKPHKVPRALKCYKKCLTLNNDLVS